KAEKVVLGLLSPSGFRMPSQLVVLLSGAMCVLSQSSEATDQGDPTQLDTQNSVISLIVDTGRSTAALLADDLRAVLAIDFKTRFRPVIGDGDVDNLNEMLRTKDLDLGIVQIDVLNYYNETGLFPENGQEVSYISQMHKEEFHLLANASIESLQELQGKRVNLGPIGGGTYLSAINLFALHDLEFIATQHPHQEALPLLKEGNIDAMVVVDGKPSEYVRDATLDDGIRLLALPSDKLPPNHEQGKFESTDYPQLLAPGDELATVAVPNVLITIEGSGATASNELLDGFVASFLSALTSLRSQASSHPKWREVHPWKQLDGDWHRHPAVPAHLSPIKFFDSQSD
ncbi:MAG: TAXI family TRAP transporter solute-binding subunit, partial [Pseudomonadota bacterium]